MSVRGALQPVWRPHHVYEVSLSACGFLRRTHPGIAGRTRAQLDIIAQLNDRTVTDDRLAIEARIEKTKSDPSVLQRAHSVRDEIERGAATEA